MRLRTGVLRGEIDSRHTGTGGIRQKLRTLRDPSCPTTLVDAAGRLAPGAGPSGVAASPKREGTGPEMLCIRQPPSHPQCAFPPSLSCRRRGHNLTRQALLLGIDSPHLFGLIAMRLREAGPLTQGDHDYYAL